MYNVRVYIVGIMWMAERPPKYNAIASTALFSQFVSKIKVGFQFVSDAQQKRQQQKTSTNTHWLVAFN